MEIFRVSKLSPDDEANRGYVAYCAKNPDRGSAFDLATRFIRSLHLPDSLLFFILIRWKRYDGIICFDEGKRVGHCFFQKHWSYWGIFSVFVPDKPVNFQNQRYATRMVAECLKLAYAKSRLREVHIGDGGHPWIQRIYERAIRNELNLPFLIEAGAGGKGAVRLVRPGKEVDAASREFRRLLQRARR